MINAAFEVNRDEEWSRFFAQFVEDPLGFVLACYPWGVKGTILEKRKIQKWQREELEALGDHIKAQKFNGNDPVEAYLAGISSGHGIGKSAFLAWVSDFIFHTRPDSQGTITANTYTQLQTKTFKELVKWTGLLKETTGCDWAQISTAELWMRHRDFPATWFLRGVSSKRENSEAFAGQHEAPSSPYYIFDEGSGVPDEIYDVAHGGLTDGEPFWFVFGNPTRNQGFFKRIFTHLRHRWRTKQIDSRDVEFTNKREIQKWVDDLGEDSDFVRVRVRGLFPKSAATQLIPNDVVHAACYHNEPDVDQLAPLVLGVDCAREGDDESVVAIRRGLDAATEPWSFFRGLDGNQLGGEVAEICRLRAAVSDPVDAIFVDATGIGASVYDFLNHRGFPVYDIHFGGKPDDERTYLYKGPEMWVAMREWMKEGGRIPEDPVLATQLTGRNKEFTPTDRMFLQSKKIMKSEGVGSPDRADALALCFASPVERRSGIGSSRSRPTAVVDYNVMEG